jgi:2-oxoglutarate ferredoxin oxidoreductase subunit alpha
MNFLIGGSAGQGVESSGLTLAKAFAREGHHVFATQEYMSRIRGGHNVFTIRISDHTIASPVEHIEVLLALNAETVEKHWRKVVPGGRIICDEKTKLEQIEKEVAEQGITLLKLPLVTIAEKEGGSPVMMNTAALGAAMGLVGSNVRFLESVIRDNFRNRGSELVEANLAVARSAHDFVNRRFASEFGWSLAERESPRRMLLSGNTAICLGAVTAGCRFISAYPMTPATSILEWYAAHANRYGLIAKQTEDEIAAITMAIGASHMGVRAMTATSGGGFSLMTEALGLAGMTETPLVIIEVQRPGPSTGLPTETGQGDLEFILHASQDEFPRIVLAPGDVRQAIAMTRLAFNLADRYQCPVILLSDHFLASSLQTVGKDILITDRVRIDRGELLGKETLDHIKEYKRYAFNASGVSPRALPGHPNSCYVATGNEHTELGSPTEDPALRRRMMRKRMMKMEGARHRLPDPELYGPEYADVTFVAWGSTRGPLLEVVDRLNDGAHDRANMIHFKALWPLPETSRHMLEKSKHLIAVEGNYSGQFARLLRRELGIHVDELITRFDGLPFTPSYILAGLEQRKEVLVNV